MDDLIQREERKRARHLDEHERWRLILEAIAWAESQATPPRNSPRRCLEEQKRLIATLAPKVRKSGAT
jgi:hypothetical protein